MASQLEAQGDDVLKAIYQMKKTSKKQKQATKENSLKFEWLKEHGHLKKLEENCSKELESLLLHLYNEASTTRESKKLEPQETPSKRNAPSSMYEDNNGASSTPLASSSSTYAAELEVLIQTEQISRVALIKQITSEREQREALKHFMLAVSKEGGAGKLPVEDNQLASEDMQANVRELIYDAVIGRQMIEATLEEEVQACEKEFGVSYHKVLETLRTPTKLPVLANSNTEEDKIAGLLDATGANKCTDEMLRIEISEEFHHAFSDCREDLGQYEQEFIYAASAIDAAGSIEAATAKCGGWSEPDEERFLKVLRSYEGKQAAGKKPQLLYDQLALVLPSVTIAEIKKHVKFHQHHRFHEQKRKDRKRELQRKLGELQAEATAKIQLCIGQEQEKLRKIQQFSEIQLQCEQLHGQVSKWRATKDAKERIERQQRELEQMIELQKQQEEELRWRRTHDKQKMVVDAYKKGKALDKMAEEWLTIEEQQKREEERLVQSVVNAERVQYRNQEFQRKLENMRQEEIHKAEFEEQRLAKLNELKEKTPYAQIIASIVPDPERTRQETAAFRANVEAAQEGLPVMETGLFPSHGYDCETLFKNARFKLGIALRNAGLSSSEYARQALANVKVCNVGAYRNHVSEPTKLW